MTYRTYFMHGPFEYWRSFFSGAGVPRGVWITEESSVALFLKGRSHSLVVLASFLAYSWSSSTRLWS